MKNVVIIGFMGTGKTTVARVLAERLSWQFVDTDREIQNRVGLSVAEIFKTRGEAYFRKLEEEVANGLAQGSRLVIATGGGMVTNPKNLAALKSNGIIIGLTAKPQVILERVNRRPYKRPLLQTPCPLRTIERLLAERQIYYAAADYTIDTSFMKIEQIVKKIIDYLKRQGICQ